MEPAAHRSIDQRDGPVGGVHRADDLQVGRKAERLGRPVQGLDARVPVFQQVQQQLAEHLGQVRAVDLLDHQHERPVLGLESCRLLGDGDQRAAGPPVGDPPGCGHRGPQPLEEVLVGGGAVELDHRHAVLVAVREGRRQPDGDVGGDDTALAMVPEPALDRATAAQDLAAAAGSGLLAVGCGLWLRSAGMDLAAAIAVAGATARMPVRQDAERLLRQVAGSGAVPDGKALSLAWLPPGVDVRPVEALHLLSLVTAHAYSAGDLHDAYTWWGLLRYLGFFDHEAGGQHPVLRVSRAGAQVAGVQRRVASEELGIAFGVLLASMHVRKALGPGVAVGIVDVDVLLRGSGAGSSGRADYVLVAGPGGDQPDGRVYFLECKGTSDPRDCGQQLTKAVGQIRGPVLEYAAQMGLAVSTVAAASQVSCVALQLADGDAGASGGDRGASCAMTLPRACCLAWRTHWSRTR